MENLTELYRVYEEVHQLNNSRKLQVEEYLQRVLAQKWLLIVAIAGGALVGLILMGMNLSSNSQLGDIQTQLSQLEESLDTREFQRLQNQIAQLQSSVDGENTDELVSKINQLQRELAESQNTGEN